MVLFECEKCHVDIVDYKGRVQVLDPIGFTHTYCKACGDEYNKKIQDSDRSIAETGKLGHLSSHPSRGRGPSF